MRRRLNGSASRMLLLVLCANATYVSADLIELDEPIVVPVKTIGASSAQAAPMDAPAMMLTAPEPVATLPGQRTPQYKTGILQTELPSVDGDGNIRFLVVSESLLQTFGRPLRFQLRPLINDKTLPEHRSQQVDTLTRSATRELPDPSEPDPNETESNEPDSGEAESDETEGTTVAYSLATDPAEIARRFALATGASLDATDSEWILNHWTSGPSVLRLRDFFQSFRGDARPAFRVLDRNHDGTLSDAELAGASDSFARCDADRNNIVNVLEIDSAAKAVSRLDDAPKQSVPFLFLIDDLAMLTDRDRVRFPLVQSLDENRDGKIDSAELASITAQSPDAILQVRFDTSDLAASSVTMSAVSSVFAKQCVASEVAGGIELRHDGTTLIFSAVQSTSSMDSQQVSLGLVQDGYPLLPGLDPNDDGRFTIRELRELPNRLRSLDANRDGMIQSDEVNSPLRIAIGLGPTVHRELASVRSIQRVSPTETLSAPDWFARMDRNRDGDLSRDEFPGNDEQFKAMDRDDDDLVDIREAIQFEQQSP